MIERLRDFWCRYVHRLGMPIGGFQRCVSCGRLLVNRVDLNSQRNFGSEQ